MNLMFDESAMALRKAVKAGQDELRRPRPGDT
jgi:hypothetical protein